MNETALALATRERDRLKNITTIGLNEVFNILQTPGTDLTDIPTQMLPFLDLGSVSATQYYEEARLLAQIQTQVELPTYVPEGFTKPSAGANTTLYGGVGSTLKMVDEVDDLMLLFPSLSGVIEKAIFNNWRDQIQSAAQKDMSQAFINIVLAPNACAWCRWLKAEDSIAVNQNRSILTVRYINQNKNKHANFHDNCRCVYGVIYEMENANKYEQPGDKQFYEVLNILRKNGVSGQEEIMKGLREAGYK